MGYLNFPPNLKDIFDDLYARIRKLETAQRFTIPVVVTDPTNRRNGDMWINSTSNTLKVVDSVGTIRVVTWI
jgi:hypothetical protein